MTAPSRRVLYVASNSYLDDSNGAAVASRAMMESLAKMGYQTEALTGTVLETRQDVDLEGWLFRRSLAFEVVGGGSWTASARGFVERHADPLPPDRPGRAGHALSKTPRS